MHENRRYFRSDVTLKCYCRCLDPSEREAWLERIQQGQYEDLCRHYLAGEEVFLKKLEKLAPNQDDFKDLFLFINKKVNYLIENTQQIQNHELMQLESQNINLGAGGCSLYQNFQLARGDTVLLEFILPHNQRYIRTLAQVVYSHAVKDRWKTGFCFDQIPIEHQDELVGYLFKCERSNNMVGDSTHQSPEDSTPYN